MPELNVKPERFIVLIVLIISRIKKKSDKIMSIDAIWSFGATLETCDHFLIDGLLNLPILSLDWSS